MRIVSLACSNTEIVHALGCGHLLVGVDDHSDWPPRLVDPLPKVGPDLDIDVEAVAGLDPDLVLATLTVPGHEKVVAELEDAGLPFIAPEPVSIPDVYRDVRQIAGLLGVEERGEALVAEMREELGDGIPVEAGAGGSTEVGGCILNERPKLMTWRHYTNSHWGCRRGRFPRRLRRSRD